MRSTAKIKRVVLCAIVVLLLGGAVGGYVAALGAPATQAEATGQPWHQDLFRIDDGQGKWGYIDASGQVVIKPAYESVRGFAEGLAAVKVGGKYGFIDTTGQMVIAPRFVLTFEFREGLAWVRGENEEGFIDKTGKIVVEPSGGGGAVLEFREGLAVLAPDTMNVRPEGPVEKTGFIDKTGRNVIRPQFDAAWDFSEGLAAVCIDRPAGAWQGGKWGFIDKTGQMVIPAKYDEAWYFTDGIAKVTHGGKAIYIDRTGQHVFAREFDDGLGFHEGLAGVKISGKWGFINRTGAVVIDPRFDGVASFFSGRARILVNKKYGYIDTEGKVIIEPQYDSGDFFLGELAGVRLGPSTGDGAGTGYVNLAGKVVWPPRLWQAAPVTQPAIP